MPGDLVVAAPGEPFPADGIVVAGEGLQVDESALTGESYPVRKQALRPLSLTSGEPAVDACQWGFAGTRLLTGEARLRIAYTGAETIYGEIVQSALSGRHARTPLQWAIARPVMVARAGAPLPHRITGHRRLIELAEKLLVLLDDLDGFVYEVQIVIGRLECRSL